MAGIHKILEQNLPTSGCENGDIHFTDLGNIYMSNNSGVPKLMVGDVPVRLSFNKKDLVVENKDRSSYRVALPYTARDGISINDNAHIIPVYGTSAKTVAEGNHLHDDRYVNNTGDTMSGNLTVNAILNASTLRKGGVNVLHETETNDRYARRAGYTANRVIISDGNGVLVNSGIGSDKIGFLSNVTSDIQSQINGKSNNGHGHDYSPSNHNHDAWYAQKNHGHDYAPSNHWHDYASSGHNHDGRYLPMWGGSLTGDLHIPNNTNYCKWMYSSEHIGIQGKRVYVQSWAPGDARNGDIWIQS